jgi:hypothetical protein
MDKIDEMIGKALNDEDRALLARHAEPGYFAQAFGLFSGPLAWVMWLVYVMGGVAFVAGLWALWQMSQSAEVLSAVKWGVGGLFLFQFTLVSKSFMGTHMETNRMLRELKRVELQLALLRDGQGR